MEKQTQAILAYFDTASHRDMMKGLSADSNFSKLIGLTDIMEDYERIAIKSQPDVLLIEYSPERKSVKDLVMRLARSVPSASIMLLSDTISAESVLEAVRLGAKEYLPLPCNRPEFNEALLRIARNKYQSAQSAGKLISFLGAKGGVGTSLIAANFAFLLSQNLGQRVALVDLVFARGDLAAMFNLKPTNDLSLLPPNFGKLDWVFVDSMLTEVYEGLRLLPAPEDPALGDSITLEHLGKCMDYILDMHTFMVADLPNTLKEIEVMVLDRSSFVGLVIEPTVLCLRSAKKTLDLCDRMGYPKDKVGVIVNRYGSKNTIKLKDVETVLGCKVGAWLPNESELAMKAADLGVPLARDWPRSKIVSNLREFANSLTAPKQGK